MPTPRMVETHAEQLRLWVRGESTHVRTPEGFECCPDFSCCRPELLASRGARRMFLASGPDKRGAMLAGFLAAMLTLEGYGIA